MLFGTHDDRPCWEVDGTLCNDDAIELLLTEMGDKSKVCIHCIYYKKMYQYFGSSDS